MLAALIHGKLSCEQENMEDLLTSCVFGVLGALPSYEALYGFLAGAQTLDENRPLEAIHGAFAGSDSPPRIDYWPYWQEPGCIGCEPDVVIRIRPALGRALVVLVEAKFQSAKSSLPDPTSPLPTDQLAREWDILHRVAERENADAVLVYLTADHGLPASDVEESIAEFRRKRPDAPVPAIAWLSWRHLESVLMASRREASDAVKDLTALLDRLGLRFFHGISLPHELPPGIWSFEGSPARFDWTALAQNRIPDWRYPR